MANVANVANVANFAKAANVFGGLVLGFVSPVALIRFQFRNGLRVRA